MKAMAMFTYPVKLEPDDNDTILVSFPDVPQAHTFGEGQQDALAHAVDALESALSMLIDDRKDIPLPSAVRRGQRSVTLPPMSAAKVALYRAMREAGVGKAELACRLGWHLPQVDRVLDLLHASKLEQIELALQALGKRLVVEVRDAAA
jgi:antitoxin HicB